MPFSFMGKDGFGMPLFEWQPPPRTIFDEIADRYGQWLRIVGDPFSTYCNPELDHWVIDGYGSNNIGKDLKQVFNLYGRCHWITHRRRRGYRVEEGPVFSDGESAVNHVREMAIITNDLIFTLAVEIHDLNDILMKARTVE